MNELVNINDIDLKINKKDFFKNFSLTFYKGVNAFICGTSASGKTLLLKAIARKIKFSGEIICNGVVALLFDKYYFSSSLVEDELRYVFLSSEQKAFVNSFFDKKMLKSNPNDLSFYNKKILLLCTFLYQNPQMVFIDNLYSFISTSDIEKFDEYFNKNKITVILISNNIEEALNYDYMIVMDKGIIALEGKTEQVLKEEKLLKRLGIGLPFYVDLSIQLQYYNLIDKVCLNKEELVDKLWN